MTGNARRLLLRNARLWERGVSTPADLLLEDERVAGVTAAGRAGREAREIDLDGRLLLPGLVNAHDHLDFANFPSLGRPPYPSVYAWAADVDGGAHDTRVAAALSLPLVDRLFLGGLRNLLAGVTAVTHHNPFHRSMARPQFPVRVLSRYQFAHSPGLTPELRRTYRSTDRRIPWMLHAAEGTDERCRAELNALRAARLVRQNTVLVHAVALAPEDLATLAEAGAAVVWCPESNRRLYGATAPVARLRAAGVAVGLGSDSPASGVRDALTNLAAAKQEGVMSDVELLELATRDSGRVARLVCGEAAPGGAADFVALDSLDDLLAGRRESVALVVCRGRALYGDPRLMPESSSAGSARVDGRDVRLSPELARRACSILASPGARAGAAWLEGVELGKERVGGR